MVSIENPVEIQLSLGNPIYRGPEGKKPVKGVDYFTQEDIDSIVAQIKGGEGIDLDGYATKEYVNEAVSGVVVSETDPTVPEWAKQATKPTYTANEVGALPADTVLFSGSYNDLTDKPTIPEVPANVSAFNNDAGYLTTHQSLTDYATKSYVETAIRGAESGFLKRSVVQELPTSDIDEDTIYMVAKTGSTGDVYDEYLYVNSNWEHIGSTDVDLTGYATETYVDNAISNIPTADKEILHIRTDVVYDGDILSKLQAVNTAIVNKTPIPYIIVINNQQVIRYYGDTQYNVPRLAVIYESSINYYYKYSSTGYKTDGSNMIDSSYVKVSRPYSLTGQDDTVENNINQIKTSYATKSYVDTAMPEYLTNTDILAIWNGNNE